MKSFKSFVEENENKKEDLKNLPVSFIGLEHDGKYLDDGLVTLPPSYVGLRNVDAGNTLGKKDIKEAVKIKNAHPALKYDTIVAHNKMYHHPILGADVHSPRYTEEHEELMHHFNPNDNYAGEMRDHVVKYTQNSRALNRYLLDRHQGVRSVDQNQENEANSLRQASFIKTSHKPLMAFAGVGAANPSKHHKSILPAFSSMSTSAEQAYGFARQDSSMPITEHPHVITGHHIQTREKLTPQFVKPEHVHAMMQGTMSSSDIARSPEYGIDTSTHRTDIAPIRHIIHAEVAKGTPMFVPGNLSEHRTEKELVVAPGAIMERHPTKPPELYADGTLVHHVKISHPQGTTGRTINRRSKQMKFDF